MKHHRSAGARGIRSVRAALGVLCAFAAAPAAHALQFELAPDALSSVPVPLPAALDEIVVDRDAALVLGKALFWDMQVGSDGIQACASCHFHAGADPRVKNSLNPGADGFDPMANGLGGPNYTLNADDFPFRKLLEPDDNESAVLFDTNDRVSSQGVFATTFTDVTPGDPLDSGTVQSPDPLGFHVGGINTRRVEPLQAPSVINAVFAHRIFWDGRANHFFNGQNPFGDTDPDATVLVRVPAVVGFTVEPERILLENAALASQAVGPPLSGFEMSFEGRAWPHLGRKLLSAQPLALQKVHPQDSVLGPYSLHPSQGLGDPAPLTYQELVEQAFHARFWDSPGFTDPDGFTQAEANFSFFFGIAVMLYEATLVSDQTRYDEWAEAGKPGDGGGILTSQELEGLEIFLDRGACVGCHAGPEFAGASISTLFGAVDPETGLPEGLLERMPMANTIAEGGLRLQTLPAPNLVEDEHELEEPEPDTVNIGFDPRYQIIEIRLPQSPSGPVAWLYFTQAGSPGNNQPRDVRVPMNRGSAAPPVPAVAPACPPADELFGAEVRFRHDGQGRFRLDIDLSWGPPGLPPGDYRVFVGGGFVGNISMPAANPCAVYDNGFYNIGVRQTEENLGIAAEGPFGPFSLTLRKQLGQDIGFDLDPPVDPNERAAVRGAVRAQQMRNIELTGPFFHNGGFATLEQMVDFYVGGAHFMVENFDDLDPEVDGMGGMDAERKAALVAFLKTLTDERVRLRSAPFDHPELFVPNGHQGDESNVTDDGLGQAVDEFLHLEEVGALGSLDPLLPFHAQLAGSLVAFVEPGLTVDEAGDLEPRQFRLALATPPLSDVTVELLSVDPGELGFEPASLVFTPANWFVHQVVTVMALEDMQVDGNRGVQVTTRPTASTDPNYAGRVLRPFTVHTRDSGRTWDRIELEAEAGVLSSPMIAMDDGSASGGRCIVVPQGTGNASSPESGGQARFNVTVPAGSASTRFVLWAKVMAPNAASNGFWYRIDQGPYVPWDAYRAPQGGWAWDRVGEITLTPGTHTLRIRHREDGAGIDSLILTNDLRFMPRGAPVEPRDASTKLQGL